eukprot:5423893-Ditylum_brightwellii.AAC.1
MKSSPNKDNYMFAHLHMHRFSGHLVKVHKRRGVFEEALAPDRQLIHHVAATVKTFLEKGVPGTEQKQVHAFLKRSFQENIEKKSILTKNSPEIRIVRPVEGIFSVTETNNVSSPETGKSNKH